MESARGEKGPIREPPGEQEPIREPFTAKELSEVVDKSNVHQPPKSVSREASGDRSEADGGGSLLAKQLANQEKELADVRTDGLLSVTGGPQTEERKNFAG